MTMPQLNIRQRRYATFIAEGMAPKDAARKAGYEAFNITRLRKDPKVRRAVKILMEASARASLISRERILSEHAKIAFREIDDVSISDQQRSLDAISRMLGYDAPKEIRVSGSIDFTRMSDDELQERLDHLKTSTKEIINGTCTEPPTDPKAVSFTRDDTQ